MICCSVNVEQYLPGVPEQTAQNFTYDRFGTVCHKMKIFAPKCSAEITVFQSMQNLCKWVKYRGGTGTRRLPGSGRVLHYPALPGPGRILL